MRYGVFLSKVTCYLLPSCCQRVVDAILVTHPLHCFGRKNLAAWLHAINGKTFLIVLQPTPKGGTAHSSCVCKLIFICCSHGLFIFCKDTEIFSYMQEKSRQNVTYRFKSFQYVSAPLQNVVPLYRQSGMTYQRVRFYCSAEEKLLLGGALGTKPR